MSVFAELKRRNVARIAVLYVVTSWAILRSAGVLFGVLDVPTWAGKLVLVLLVLGFPVALVLSWIYEITPDGLRRFEGAQASGSAAAATRRKLDIAIGVLAAIAIGTIAVDRLMPERAAPVAVPAPAAPAQDRVTADARSIAVLPFMDMSQSRDQEYFADGLSEELMTVLARIEDLRVVGRTSSFQYKGRDEDLRAIGESLGVAHLLEGSVRKSGDSLRITAQLIRAADGSQLWSEIYDRKVDDIFVLQDEIAAAVAGALKVRLAVPGPAGTRAERDIEAYTRYLQGRYQLELRSRESLDLALAHFKAAIELEPRDALAWVGLSETYTSRASYTSQLSLDEGYRLGREAVERALALDPALAHAHAALGYIQAVYDWNWPAADASIERAIQLAPRDPDILMKAALQDQTMGRFERSIARYRQAIGFDPLRAALSYNLSRVYLVRGQDRDAEALARRVIGMMPSGAGLYVLLAETLLAQGRADEAAGVIAHESDPLWKSYGEAMIEFARGRQAPADAALEALVAGYGTVAAYQISEVYAFRGERDEAFTWLERAFRQRDGGLAEMLTSRHVALLKSDPRYRAMLARLGLPETG
ncbi:MAG: hypothetical protein IT486_00640 [Gammaproteobacteria bacterium]|nr:hypothetical protein [Gammaproteobacteria bacterium]